MQINDVVHGFRVVRKRENKELGGVLWEMEHIKTGAPLAWVDNGNDNKLFSIAFMTLPWDDTGVFHILEHSVLAGSESFPVKEPFLDLLKSSMNTFLNAMTFPDKTMYPVSSRNDQDFLNLTKVYLDAVFKPAIFTNPNIFYQEGWHYEIREKTDAPVFKGVVFNEMKGSFANINSLLDYGITRLIFPDTPYGYVSGGDPEKIPDLTYERFLEAHREFYHPTNSKIYLDGNVPLDKVLRLLDEEYLGAYDKSDKVHEVKLQGTVPAKRGTETYPIGADEDEKEKTHITLGKTLCDWSDRKKLLALNVLSTYLTGSNDAPLKKAILEKKLAQSVVFGVDDGIAEPYMTLIFKNTEADRLPEIKATVRKAVCEVLEKGIDTEELEAILSLEEYGTRDMEEPAGLIRNINGLSSWLYGGDILLYLTHGDVIDAVKKEIGTDYFASLLKETVLDEAHLSEFILVPSKTKTVETEEKEKARLKKAKESWTEEDILSYIEKNKALDLWQEADDTPEAKATLPVLSISDVDPAPVWTPTEEMEERGVKVLWHKVPSNGISHVRAYYSVNDLALDCIPALQFVASLLGELPTRRHSVSEIKRRRRKYIGDLDFTVEAFSHKMGAEKANVTFTVIVSALTENLPAAAELVHEIMTETVFTDAEKIREVLLQVKNAKYNAVLSRGNAYAVSRALRNLGASFAAAEKITGYDNYQFLKDFADQFDSDVNSFTSFAENILRKLYVPERLVLSETAEEYHSAVSAFIPEIKGEKAPEYKEISIKAEPLREAVLIPSGVSYAGKGYTLSQAGGEYHGALAVLSNILTYGYLWGEIRIKGGAYGCGFRAPKSGSLAFYSYRDPAPVNAVKVFDETGRFIESFADSDEDVVKYIISTVASTEPLIEPALSGANADRLYFMGRTYEDASREKAEILATDKETLKKEIPLFDALAKNASTCIVGNETELSKLPDDWTKLTV